LKQVYTDSGTQILSVSPDNSMAVICQQGYFNKHY